MKNTMLYFSLPKDGKEALWTETQRVMKTIDEYMKLPYTVELIPDADEGGFTASIPALAGCLSAGETSEEAYRNIEKAKHEWLVAAMEEDISLPEPDSVF